MDPDPRDPLARRLDAAAAAGRVARVRAACLSCVASGACPCDQPPVCSSCQEPDPTTKHREFTGGPDGDLCDQCVADYLNGQRESPQF